MDSSLLHQAVLHLPIVTTVCAAVFATALFARWRVKGGGLHLVWWGIGMVTYGVGTFTESLTTLFGWHPIVFRCWYVAGAFLGGWPLAQGSIYLLARNRRLAHAAAIVVGSIIAVASILVFLSPLDPSLAETHRLSGRVLGWSWLRLISPFINLWSVVFLVGGAAVSAWRFRGQPTTRHKVIGNVLIALGALLPGIGGTATRAGFVEVLYVTELIGLLLIWAGYRYNISTVISTVISPVVSTTPAVAKENNPMLRITSIVCAVALTLTASGVRAAEVASSSTPSATPAESAATETETDASATIATSIFATTTVTATGTEKNTFSISTPVSVIDESTIERRQAQNAAELLRDAPGVDVNGVGPNQGRPIIRGQRGLRVLFLEDGLRLNNPRRQTDFGEITGLVALEDVARAEVVRGPASVLYGTDAIGGVLNLVTKTPALGDGFRAGATVGWRGAGDQVFGAATLAGRHDRLSYRLNYGRRDGDDYDAPSGSFGEIDLAERTTVVDTGLEDENGSALFGFDPNASHQLALRWTRYRAEQTGFGFVEPDAYGVTEPFRIRILYPYQEFDRMSLRWEGAGLELPVADSVRLQVYGQRNERRLVNDIDIDIGPLFPGAPNSSVASDTNNFTELETLGLRADAMRGLGTSQLVTWGVEGYRDESRNTDSSVTVTTLRFPFPPFRVVDTATDTVANAPNATNESVSLFAQDEWFASSRLTVTGGLRWQRVATRAEATPGWDTAGLDFDDDAVVGSLSAVWGLTDTLRLVAGVGTAFRAPSLIERLFNGPTPEGAGYQLLNPELESERSEAIDLGLKYLSGRAFGELVVFRNEIHDGVIQSFYSPAEIAALPQSVRDAIAASGADFVVQQRNADRLRYEGVELVGGWRSTAGLVLEGSYTYLDGERIDSTNPPTGDQASDRLTAAVRYEPRSNRWWAEYRLRWQDRQRANIDPDEPVPPVGAFLPSFTTHQIGAGFTVFERGNQRHGVQLLVDNVTDELYAEASNTTFFRPQPGREVSLTWRSAF